MVDDIVPAAPGRKQGDSRRPAKEDRPRKKRQPMKATAAALERSAQRYIERYETATDHLRWLLMIKVARSAQVHGTDAEEGAAAVEALLERFQRAGILDDQRFARARVRSLHRRGSSRAMIRARLAAKGVARAVIDEALEEAEGSAEERDLAAALTFARRRRLGPYRAEGREERRERDLAALGRQGFDYETARRVIDCEDPAALLADLTPE